MAPASGHRARDSSRPSGGPGYGEATEAHIPASGGRWGLGRSNPLHVSRRLSIDDLPRQPGSPASPRIRQLLSRVIRLYYDSCREAPGSYRGIPLEDLIIERIEWPEEIANYIRSRSKRRSGDMDVEPEWATEAALDPMRLVGVGSDPKSGRESLSLTVVGYSPSSAEVLAVWLRPKDLDAGEGYGQNAAKARRQWRREYMERRTS